MHNPDQRLQELYERFLANKLSAEELDQFLKMTATPSNNKMMKELMDRTWSDIQAEQTQAPVVSIRRNYRARWVAAAVAIILILGASDYLISINKSSSVRLTSQTPAQAEKPVADHAPGRNVATLTLANGEQIVLDSSNTGTLANQGNTKIIKLSSGQLSYASSKSAAAEVFYNTLTTPRGGQYQIELPDGSQVWLNAASTLHFPTAFTGSQRIIDLTGEAYFEVAKNRQMPFIVRVNGSEIKVLGTHFNVNAYTDEPIMKTTLLEGSVECSKGSNKNLLKPGQQAQFDQNSGKTTIATADIEEAVAWKNGFFQFNNSDIVSVMKQVSRWYDLDVEYEGEKPAGHFRGKISRSVPLSEMLNVIEVSGVHFKLEEKTLKVLP